MHFRSRRRLGPFEGPGGELGCQRAFGEWHGLENDDLRRHDHGGGELGWPWNVNTIVGGCLGVCATYCIMDCDWMERG
jgi:hypothetical protein